MFSIRNRILDKWLFNEFLGPFFAVLFGFLLFAILAMDLYQMIDLVSSKQVPIFVIFHMLFLRLPFWIVFALPVSLLFAIFLSVSRLIQDGEFRAVRTSGCSKSSIFYRFAFVGVLISLFSFFIQEKYMKDSLTEYFEIVAKFSQSDLIKRVEPGKFVSGPNNMYYYFGDISQEGTIRDIRILKLNLMNSPRELVRAESGNIENQILQLNEGQSIKFSDEGSRIKILQNFKKAEIDLSREFSGSIPVIDSPLVDNASTLKEKVENHKSRSFYPKRLLAREETELYYRYSLPFANLIFVIFAFPLALSMGQSGRTSAFFVAVVSFTVYWGLIGVGRALGYTMSIPPLFAGWLPNAIFLIIGILFLLFLKRKNV
ncbi:hypothetical protein CL659_04125 [bacterium]|nr:hypothetical protein [bacterium]